MPDPIALRVFYRGSERLLRLHDNAGRWYAHLLIPGKKDVFGENPVPSPPGTILPKLEVESDPFMLKIEAPAGNIASMPMSRLTASGAVQVKDDWMVVPLDGIMWDYGDGAELRQRDEEKAKKTQKSAQVLRFPTKKKDLGQGM